MKLENSYEQKNFETLELAFYKQLAIQKLKKLEWIIHWKGLLSVFSLFRRAELVQHVGPGLPPRKEHEWRAISMDQFR